MSDLVMIEVLDIVIWCLIGVIIGLIISRVWPA